MSGPVPAAFLLFLLAGVPLLAARTGRPGRIRSLPRASLYVSVAISHWALALLAAAAVAWEGGGAASVGLVALHPAAFLAWSAAATLAGLVLLVAFRGLGRILGRPGWPDERHVLPGTARERLLFVVLVAPTAGFVEELLYRGYVLGRLAPLAGGEVPAALVAALAFALGHLYQGPLGVARAAALGALLAVAVLATGSLWPAIAAHAAIDVAAGALWPRHFLGPGGDGEL